MNSKTSSYRSTKYRAVKKECGEKVWYETQCSPYGEDWRDDHWPRFDTEREIREYVARLNKPLPTVTTTVLKD